MDSLRPGRPHTLSVAERDRRYAAIRQAMHKRGLDALVVDGTNLLYLSCSLPGELLGLLPAEPGEDFEVLIHSRHLIDIPASVMLDAQTWVKRVRSGRNAVHLADRLRELHCDKGTIGYAGTLGYDEINALKKAVPAITLVDAADILADVRTIKSAEEIALIDRANHIFDAAIQRIQHEARPGMTGRQVMQIGINAMWEAGGDLNSAFSFNFGARPQQSPVLAEQCLDRRIEPGDIGTLTAHSHYHHYAGHSDQELVFGDPNAAQVKQFEAVKKVRDLVLRRVSAEATQRDLQDVYEEACAVVGYDSCEHSQIHQYGIDIPEFPGPSFRLQDPKIGKGLGPGGNFKLVAGMIYSISPTLVDPATGGLLLGGTSLAVTPTGYRELGARQVELLVAG